MDVGEIWAYRARSQDPLVRVEVLRVGVKRPPRLLVRFLDAEFEGREDWVSPARLKVTWDGVEAFRFAEQRWDAVAAVSEAAVDSVEHQAVMWVVNELLPQGCYDSRDLHRCAVLRVRDAAAFTGATGSEATDVAVAPGYVDDDGSVVASWNTLLAVSQRLAEQHADRVLEVLRREDEQAEHEAIHGRFYPGRNGGMHIEPETCAELDTTIYRPARDVVRQWCGAGPRQRMDELIALRAEVLRLGGLVDEAITELRQAGRGRQADDLERRLGVPVAQLRKGTMPQ
ncbi:hypothetical protein ACFPIJ_48255 [Dactylosporangium cerinum]|uniref:PE-PGRS family protein n=1 Tax=Dactylosporangium cerinum TaxID=1434730 RepID=A0ABV9WA35_9ACTN